LSRLKDTNSQMALNVQQRSRSGALIDSEVRCSALEVDGHDALAYVTHDVSLRRKAEQQLIDNQQRLDRMAHHDQLTGLPNRHYLTSFLPQAIADAKTTGTMLGVVFLDLDRFKHINDTRGMRPATSYCKRWRRVCVRACATATSSSAWAATSSWWYSAISPPPIEVTAGAGRIVEALHNPIIIERQPLQTTGSVGVSMYPRDGADMIELLKHSDTAMLSGQGSRPQQRPDVQPHHGPKTQAASGPIEASLRDALRLRHWTCTFNRSSI